mgnify:CR=1 FL=1
MGYVVLIPLAATVFFSLGRHPLAGLAAAFAGVSLPRTIMGVALLSGGLAGLDLGTKTIDAQLVDLT